MVRVTRQPGVQVSKALAYRRKWLQNPCCRQMPRTLSFKGAVKGLMRDNTVPPMAFSEFDWAASTPQCIVTRVGGGPLSHALAK